MKNINLGGGAPLNKRTLGFLNPTIFLTTFFTISLLSLGFVLNSFLFPSLPTSASITSGAEVGLNIKDFIKVAVDTSELALVDGSGNTSITPEPTGTLITGDVNVAVTTNTALGYSLIVYTQDNSTAMVHSDPSVENAINSIDTISGYDANTGVADLSANTWGFRKRTTTGLSNWYAVGENVDNGTIIVSTDTGNSAYCENLSFPLNDSGCNAGSYDTHTINFGAKLTPELPSGTYTNNVVFSAVAKSEGTRYTLNFNPNGGENTMGPRTIVKGSTLTMPTKGFVKEGYAIKGWALTQEDAEIATSNNINNTTNPSTTPTNPIYSAGQTIEVTDLILAAITAGQNVEQNALVNIYAVWDTSYTLAFNSGNTEATGTTEPINTSLTSTITIPDSTFTLDGYTFLGWALSQADSEAGTVATIGTTKLEAGATISTNALITAAAAKGQDISTTQAGTIQLLGVWKKAIDGNMQGFTECNNMEIGEIKTLTDIRDNTNYKIKKLSDERCWMLDNLTISGSNLQVSALTNENTNIPSSDTKRYYLPPQNTRYSVERSINNAAVLSATDEVNFSNSSTNDERTVFSKYPQVAYKEKGTTDNTTGNQVPENTAYYNYYTATLGYSYYGSGTSGSSPRDICPKGWRLPWSSDSGTTRNGNAEFYTLGLAYNSDSSAWSNYIAPGSTGSSGPYSSNATVRQNMVAGDSGSLDRFANNGAAGFTYAGQYDGTSLNYVGTNGYYLSASLYNSNSIYSLSFSTSSINMPGTNGKTSGYPVRCVTDYDYTISFDANGGEGIMDSILAPSASEYVSLPDNTFTRENYTFLGWSPIKEALSSTYSNKQSIKRAATKGGNNTLYAVWRYDLTDSMQGWASCDDMRSNEIRSLKDTRDNKTYRVKKLPDGKCWMIDNLLTAGVQLTPDDTNIADGRTYYLPGKNTRYTTADPFNTSNTTISSDILSASDSVNFGSSYSNQVQVAYQNKGSTTNTEKVALPEATAYYNFYTVTLGFSYFNDGKTSGSSTQDICPKGWHLPWTSDLGTTADGNGEFYTLTLTYGNNQVNWADYVAPGSTNETVPWVSPLYGDDIIKYMDDSSSHALGRFGQNSAAGFTRIGYYSSGTELHSVGEYGGYWSSSKYNNIYAYSMDIGWGVQPDYHYHNAYYGQAVRCVANETMQNFDGAKMRVGQIKALTDTRDRNVYHVKKLPDGKVWMLDNLTISGTSLTPNDTNVSDGRTYYLPSINARYTAQNPFSEGEQINPDILSASAQVDFSTDTSNQVQIGYRSKGSTDNDTGNAIPENTAYYNFYTATLGFSYYNDGKTSGSSTQDICPKGWHMPWASDSGKTGDQKSEYYNLALKYNSSVEWTNPLTEDMSNNPRTDDMVIRQNMVSGDSASMDRFANNGAIGFTYGGYYYGMKVNGVGGYGRYGTSSVHTATRGYRLAINTENVSPLDSDNKFAGYAIRCVENYDYTITFEPNGGTGDMPTQRVPGNDNSVKLNANNYIKKGYNFIGWNIDKNATTVQYANEETVPNLIGRYGNITLYAIWERITTDGTMQEFTDCEAMDIGDIKALRDTRDDNVYRIKKLSDGKCWMIENLALAGVALTPEDTNINNGRTYYLPGKNKKYSVQDPFASNDTTTPDILDASEPINFDTDNWDSRRVQVGYRDATPGDSDSRITGIESTAYYNYYTVSLGYALYNGSRSTGSTNNDICPKGWRLPWATNNGKAMATADTHTLAVSYNPEATWKDAPDGTSHNYPKTTNATIKSNMITGFPESINRFDKNGAAGYTVAGRYNGSILEYLGKGSFYWTSSLDNNKVAYSLYIGGYHGFSNMDVLTQTSQYMEDGLPVRCIAKQ